MMKVDVTTSRKELEELAKSFGVDFTGVEKEDLVEKVNEKIDEAFNGDYESNEIEEVDETPQLSVVEQEESIEQIEAIETEDEGQVEEAKESKRQAGRWYEAEGAFPYNEGEIIKIIGGDILIDREAVVVKPSVKRNALKAHLINPKDNTLQKTMITLDFDKIELLGRKEEGEQMLKEYAY